MNQQAGHNLSKTQKVAALVGASVLSFVIVFLIAEASLRLFNPQQEAMRWAASNEKYGYVLKKNFNQDYPFIGSDFVMNVKYSGPQSQEGIDTRGFL